MKKGSSGKERRRRNEEKINAEKRRTKDRNSRKSIDSVDKTKPGKEKTRRVSRNRTIRDRRKDMQQGLGNRSWLYIILSGKMW